LSDFEILTSKDSQKWKEYLSMLPIEQQDVYFTPEYYSLYEANGDGSARCFVFKKDGNIALYPFLINKINDLGYDLDDEYYDIQGAYGYNGVVSSTYDTNFVDSFYEVFSNYVNKQHIVCEFVRFHPLLQNVGFSCKHLEAVYDRKTICLDLNIGYNHVWEALYSSNNRNMLRKASKSNLDCVVTPLTDSILAFQEIYTKTMERVAASKDYFFSQKYFQGFASKMEDYSYMVLCVSEQGVEAASLFLIYGMYAHYHLSGRGSSCKHNFVTNMILDKAIKFAIESGCSTMHLGGGRSAASDDSLFKFKQNFSSDTKDFYIGKKVHDKKAFDHIVSQWKLVHPQSAAKYGHMLQGYRKLDA
jgi:hypothetical protein